MNELLSRRIVVKVGTSTLTYENGKLNLKNFENLCKVLSDLQNMGKQVILVSSGAIGVGFGKLNLPEDPRKPVINRLLPLLVNASLCLCMIRFLENIIILLLRFF